VWQEAVATFRNSAFAGGYGELNATTRTPGNDFFILRGVRIEADGIGGKRDGGPLRTSADFPRDRAGIARAGPVALFTIGSSLGESSMNARSYLEWSRLSGIYSANVSHADRYATYARALSSAGLAAVIVGEFLEDAGPTVDIPAWRTHSVYEFGADQQRRITLTAIALETIGATQAAAVVREAKSQSPFEALRNINPSNPGAFLEAMGHVKGPDVLGHLRESLGRMLPGLAANAGGSPPPSSSPSPARAEWETREQIEQLLERFVAANEAELQGDLDRHGDPRTRAGFTVEDRQRELEAARNLAFSRDRQKEDVAKLEELMPQIDKLDSGDESRKKGAGRLKNLRRQFLELLKQNRGLPAEERIPAMASLLPKAEAFREAHSALFRPDHIGDEALRQQAEAFGEFETASSGGVTRITWDAPKGFEASWTRFSLIVSFPKKEKAALAALLRAIERTGKRFLELVEEWRGELVRGFRENYQGQMPDWELEEYELDDNEEATEESVLASVGAGTISLAASDPEGEEIFATTFFDVEWDEEHGLELEWTDEPEVATESGETQEFTTGAVQITEAGPPATAADILRFETQFGVELPREYRAFLLGHNGGVPQPGGLVVKAEGAELHADLLRFFSLSGVSEAPWPPDSLEAARHLSGQTVWPANLQPIARVSLLGVGGEGSQQLVMRLGGRRSGELILLDAAGHLAMFPGLPAQFDAGELIGQMAEHGMRVAKSLGELFTKKLKTPPQVALPDWLSAIRENDAQRFAGWLAAGGTLKEKFTHPEIQIPLTAVDYLTREGSVDLLRTLVDRALLRPKQIRASWEQFCLGDVDRFETLMPLLPKSVWPAVLASPRVWEFPALLERLAEAGVDFDAPIDDEGATPLHRAVQMGNQEGVRWLIAQGADVRKADKYQRTAFIWAERGPGFACLPILEGKESRSAGRPAVPDVKGLAALKEAASHLEPGVTLRLSIQIKSPPVTRIEKAYYPIECHYALTMDLEGNQVTFKDMTTPRQDYLYADGAPSHLYTPILQWPELTPLWETLEVQEFHLQKAIKSRKYVPMLRPDLIEAARSVLEQAFDAEEAAARGIELRK